jgi:hypothetical protein
MNEALINDEARAASILDRIPAGRWGSPDDFKGPVVFLASRASSYVSGEILTVDGGCVAIIAADTVRIHELTFAIGGWDAEDGPCRCKAMV